MGDVLSVPFIVSWLYILKGNRKRPFRERDWGRGNKRSHKFLDELLNLFIAMIYRHFYGNHLPKK